MTKKVTYILIALLLIISLSLSLGTGCDVLVDSPPSSEAGEDFNSIAEAWDIITDDYVGKDDIDTQALSQAAIEGMLEALDDPYSDYLNPDDYQLNLSTLSGQFEGIGAYVGLNENDQIMIIAPIPDLPAEKAGIRAGDIILAINGEPTDDIGAEEAVIYIRGPKGTSVSLLILHEGESEPEEIEIVRDTIEVPSVNFEMIGNIAHIHITHFID